MLSVVMASCMKPSCRQCKLKLGSYNGCAIRVWKPRWLPYVIATLSFLVQRTSAWSHCDFRFIESCKIRRRHAFIQSSYSAIVKPTKLRRSVSHSDNFLESQPTDVPMNQRTDVGRRFILSKSFRYIFACMMIGGTTLQPCNSATAAFFYNDHRQIELCLVSVLRVLYWAQYQDHALDTAENDDRLKALYLETRVGAKAALTGRASGSGATPRVYTLATLQLPACLADLEWHATHSKDRRREGKSASVVTELIVSFRESFASIVEFDGLNTLTDPSPRSALTMSQYDEKKLLFVRRILKELVVPTGQQLLIAFGPESYQQSLSYVQQYYAGEVILDPG